MTKMQLIAKLVLTLLGLFLLAQFLENAHLIVVHVFSGHNAMHPVLGVFLVALYCSVSCLLLWCLLFENKWAQKMIGPTYAGRESLDVTWVAAGFRLVFFFCGAMMIPGSVSFLLKAAEFAFTGPRVVIHMIIYRYVDRVFLKEWDEWLHLVLNVVRTLLAVYMVLGAPHYVRWLIETSYSHPASQNSRENSIIENWLREGSSNG